jgi:hypothetical protein
MVFDPRNGFQLDDNEIPLSHQLCQKTKIDRSADHHCNRKGILGRWPCAQGSVKPEKPSSRLRCMGDSSGNETNSPVIRVYDGAGNVIETHKHKADFANPKLDRRET